MKISAAHRNLAVIAVALLAFFSHANITHAKSFGGANKCGVTDVPSKYHPVDKALRHGTFSDETYFEVFSGPYELRFNAYPFDAPKDPLATPVIYQFTFYIHHGSKTTAWEGLVHTFLGAPNVTECGGGMAVMNRHSCHPRYAPFYLVAFYEYHQILVIVQLDLAGKHYHFQGAPRFSN